MGGGHRRLALAAATLLAYAPLGRIAPGIIPGIAALYEAFRGIALPLAMVALVPTVLGDTEF